MTQAWKEAQHLIAENQGAGQERRPFDKLADEMTIRQFLQTICLQSVAKERSPAIIVQFFNSS